MSGVLSYGDSVSSRCGSGTGSGTVTLTADDLHSYGTYESGGALPLPVAAVVIGLDFAWVRTGVSVEASVRAATVRLDVVGIGWVDVVSTGVGEGAGIFAVVGDPSDCVTAGTGPAEATIAVEGSLAQNHPPSPPTWVFPSRGETYVFGEPSRFRLNAVDPEGEPYKVLVTVRDRLTGEVVASFETLTSPSGVDTLGTPAEPLQPGPYTAVGVPIDARGSVGLSSEGVDFSIEPVSALEAVPGELR